MSATDVDQIYRERLVATGCYEFVMRGIFNTEPDHYYRWRYIYRITPKCAHRMIKRGYLYNPENTSLGKSVDFERAYLGLKSQYFDEVQK